MFARAAIRLGIGPHSSWFNKTGDKPQPLSTIVDNKITTTRMWANAQRDGRPAEHMEAHSVQLRKVWLTPTT